MESCRNIAIRLPSIAGFLCRAIFRGCAEIDNFGEIFTSGTGVKGSNINTWQMLQRGGSCMSQNFYKVPSWPRPVVWTGCGQFSKQHRCEKVGYRYLANAAKGWHAFVGSPNTP